MNGVSDQKYAEGIRRSVSKVAGEWLNTIENWEPVVEGVDRDDAHYRCEGQYELSGKNASARSPGAGGKTCSNEEEAKAKVRSWFDGWLRNQSASQKDVVFTKIKEHHRNLEPHSTRISETEEKWQETCGKCNGLKGQTCPSCNGQRKISCTSCNRKGSWTCSGCSGRKGKWVPGFNSQGDKVWESCFTCNGRGKEYCQSCSGKGSVHCGRCSGSGWLGCRTCQETGIETFMISATVDLYISTSVRQKESADGATFGPIADKIWDKGSKKGIPGFEISREICWREDLKITEVSPGVYSGEFEALLPFFYVEMKPDERFPGSNTDALFCGKQMSPIDLGKIFDSTIMRLVNHRPSDIDDQMDEIKTWTATKLCDSVKRFENEDNTITALELLQGISPAVTVVILDAYKHLETNFSKSTKTINKIKLAGKTLKFTAVAYALCVVVGMLVLSQTMKTGTPYAVNWDVVGFGDMARGYVDLIDQDFYERKGFAWASVSSSHPWTDGAFASDKSFYFHASGLAVILTLFIRLFLSGPKPWKLVTWSLVLVFSVFVAAGVVLHAYGLPEDVYYVFPDDYSLGQMDMLKSELLGTLVMIPELMMLSVAIAYRRIRKGQDDKIKSTLSELKSESLKKKLGYSKA